MLFTLLLLFVYSVNSGEVIKRIDPNTCSYFSHFNYETAGTSSIKSFTPETCRDAALADSKCWKSGNEVMFTISGTHTTIDHDNCRCAKGEPGYYRHPITAVQVPTVGCWKTYQSGTSCGADSDCTKTNYHCKNGVCTTCDKCNEVDSNCVNIVSASGACGCRKCMDYGEVRKIASCTYCAATNINLGIQSDTRKCMDLAKKKIECLHNPDKITIWIAKPSDKCYCAATTCDWPFRDDGVKNNYCQGTIYEEHLVYYPEKFGFYGGAAITGKEQVKTPEDCKSTCTSNANCLAYWQGPTNRCGQFSMVETTHADAGKTHVMQLKQLPSNQMCCLEWSDKGSIGCGTVASDSVALGYDRGMRFNFPTFRHVKNQCYMSTIREGFYSGTPIGSERNDLDSKEKCEAKCCELSNCVSWFFTKTSVKNRCGLYSSVDGYNTGAGHHTGLKKRDVNGLCCTGYQLKSADATKCTVDHTTSPETELAGVSIKNDNHIFIHLVGIGFFVTVLMGGFFSGRYYGTKQSDVYTSLIGVEMYGSNE